MFRGNFFEIFLAQYSMGVESSKIFQKIKKIPNFQKCPKLFPKVSKRVLNMSCGTFFEKKFQPSVPWKVDLRKTSKKSKKTSKFQKLPKSFPKVSQRVLNMFWGNFFENFFCPMFHGGSSLRKIRADRAVFFQLLSKCYVKRLNEKLFLENMKRKMFYDNTVISFTKEVFSCECHHRVQFFKDKVLRKLLVCSQKYVGSVTH